VNSISDLGKQAIERLRQVELTPAETEKGKKQQLGELEKMIKALGQGSGSLNQRATTLAALAVAALGAFGVFSAHIGDINPSGLKIAAAALVGTAGVALLAAATFALASVLPGGRWTATFADRVETVAEGKLDTDLRCRHLLRAIKAQLERNYQKATLMKKAYWLTGVALVAATLAVITALIGALV